jgi:4-amino-4-deoxy-L-arabinose transferase-like glycosyltransferase
VGWCALFLAGQVATLLLIEAGPLVRYQHYPPLRRLLSDSPPAALAVFGLQALAVVLGLVHARPTLMALLRRARGWTVLGVGVVFVLTSATLSRSIPDYAGELLFASLVQLVHLGNLLLILGHLPDAWLGRLEDRAGRILGPRGGDPAETNHLDRFAWIPALWVTGVALVLTMGAYQMHPHVPDEVAYLLPARYFAEGRISLPLPAVPAAFNVDLMTYQATRWFSPVNPGWPAILAVGALAGLPWLVNPLLAGLNVLLAYRFLREIYPRRTARIAVLLFAASPWNLFMAMNLMPHTATLTCALGAAVAVARLRRDPRLRWAVLGGLGVGMVGLIRPLEGAAVGILLGLWALGARGRRFRLAPAAALTIASLATGALVLPYNRHLTGSATTFPIMAYTDALYGPGRNELGFGPNRGMGWPGLDPLPGHGPADVAINANFNLFQINTELLGWATGSLLVLLVWLASRRLRRPDWMMLAIIGVVAGLHSFYYFSGGPDFGARYWFLVIVPCLALTARGIEHLEDQAEPVAPGGAPRILAGIAALMAVATLVFIPWRAIDKYYHYRGMRPDLRRLAAAHPLRDGIVLVRGQRHPDYASAMVYNPVDFSASRPLYAWDRGPEVRRQLAQAFPGRSFWIVDGPTVTGDGYQLLAGPLTGAQLLQRPDSLVAPP